MNRSFSIFVHETVKQIVYSPEVRTYIFSCAKIMTYLLSRDVQIASAWKVFQKPY